MPYLPIKNATDMTRINSIQEYKILDNVPTSSAKFSKQGIPIPKKCPDCKSDLTGITVYEDGAISIECEGCFQVIENVVTISESGRKQVNPKYRTFLNNPKKQKKDNRECLIIHSIDPIELDRQRLELVKLLDKNKIKEGKLLWGLVNMLNEWSDNRYHMKQNGVSPKTCHIHKFNIHEIV